MMSATWINSSEKWFVFNPVQTRYGMSLVSSRFFSRATQRDDDDKHSVFRYALGHGHSLQFLNLSQTVIVAHACERFINRLFIRTNLEPTRGRRIGRSRSIASTACRSPWVLAIGTDHRGATLIPGGGATEGCRGVESL